MPCWETGVNCCCNEKCCPATAESVDDGSGGGVVFGCSETNWVVVATVMTEGDSLSELWRSLWTLNDATCVNGLTLAAPTARSVLDDDR